MFNEEDEEIEDVKDQIINEEYKIWKYNYKYLYDNIIISPLEWPSLTVSYIPHVSSQNNIESQSFILGTHAPPTEQNFLMLCNIKFPSLIKEKKNDKFTYTLKYTDEALNAYKKINKKIDIAQRINHHGEVNVAKAMPQKTNLIATKSPNGEVQIFNTLKHPENPDDLLIKPDIKLPGHTKEGFGLDWNTLKEGLLVSGSDDHRICLWDINKYPESQGEDDVNMENNTDNIISTNNNRSEPLYKTYDSHQRSVNNVCFNKIQPNVFGSVGDDKKLMIWDYRYSDPVFTVEAHVQEVNTLDFNPFNEYLILTGSNDKTCALWDMRNLKQKLYNFKHHKNDVLKVSWCPHVMSVFASSSSDRRINIWDLSNITNSKKKDENNELLFTHGGHTSKVNDFDWNPNKEFEIASVSEDNILQIWKMSDAIYYGNETED